MRSWSLWWSQLRELARGAGGSATHQTPHHLHHTAEAPASLTRSTTAALDPLASARWCLKVSHLWLLARGSWAGWSFQAPDVERSGGYSSSDSLSRSELSEQERQYSIEHQQSILQCLSFLRQLFGLNLQSKRPGERGLAFAHQKVTSLYGFLSCTASIHPGSVLSNTQIRIYTSMLVHKSHTQSQSLVLSGATPTQRPPEMTAQVITKQVQNNFLSPLSHSVRQLSVDCRCMQ